MFRSVTFNVKGWGTMRLFFVLSLIFLGLGGKAYADDATTPEKDSDGYYLITSKEDLEWFATQVNTDTATINGRLTADIDISYEGDVCWTPIGKSITYLFKGKFDGQGHTISGLRLRVTYCQGLFGRVDGATIENLTLEQPSYSTYNPNTQDTPCPIGTVCAEAERTVIRNCHVNQANFNLEGFSSASHACVMGGVVGEAIECSKIVNCSFSGYVTTADTKVGMVGGIVGSLVLSEVDSCNVTKNSTEMTKIAGGQYVGGIVGVCQSRTAEVSIRNCTVADDAVIECTDTSTVGSLCGYVNVGQKTINMYDGVYEIYNASQLALFRDKVNGGDKSIKGRLMSDVDMADAGEFTPIGVQSAGGYQGVFDGQGYTISNLTIKDQEYAGLFGYLSGDNTVIKNINLKSPKLTTIENDYLGMLVGMAHGGPTIYNCNVTDANLLRDGSKTGEPNFIGGIAGKADTRATIDLCSFQGTVKAMEYRVGGIVGELNSGACVKNCYVMGSSTVWGNDMVGGVVGQVIDDATTVTDCYVDQSTGQVTVHATDGNTSGLIWGKNGSTKGGTYTQYTEDGLIYEKMGRKDGGAEMMVVTGVSDKSQSIHHVVNDIGTAYDYATDSVAYLPGVKQLEFIDCNSNIAGTEAYRWINMRIADGAFDSNFEKLYLRYKVYAGDDHTVALRPSDVRPVGKNMFVNCPKAKVCVDAEYYNEFIADSLWSNYKDNIVAVTDTRTADFTEDGVKYAYDRNRNSTASYVTKKGTDGSDVRMVHVIGCDNSTIAGKSGELKIYKDIGETYNYNTTRVWANSFKGNTAIKHVKFEEIMTDARDSYYDLKIELGDSAFANCENLEYFDVVLSSDKGNDHYSTIHPQEMPIGKGVFDGCKNVKIRIPAPLMDEFRNDSAWSQYKDLFVGQDFGLTAFTEAGVNYSYYISEDGSTCYTNKNATEMEGVLAPYMSTIRNFKADDVLNSGNSSTLYYVYASGVDDSEIKANGGEVRIYNDIGTYYNYKTISISATGFQNNENIRKIVFEDCASNVSNANSMLSLFIPDGTFKGCKNLKELNLYYYQTDGTNRYYALKPTEIFIGENVFEGVDDDFRIVVSPNYYNDFINDDNWSQYSKYIVASEYLPTTEPAKTIDGVTYDYAANSLNTIPTTTLSSLQVSAVLTGMHVATVVAAAVGTLGTGLAAEAAASAWKAATYLSFAITSAKVAAVQYQQRTQTNDGPGMSAGEWAGLGIGLLASVGPGWAKGVIPDVFLRALSAAVWDFTSYQVYFTVNEAVKSTMFNRLDYLSHRIERNYKRATVNSMNGVGIYYTQQRTNIPQMYISNVSDDIETAHIYNDIGTGSADYRTTAVGRKAFRDKTNLRRVDFYDRADNHQSLSSMQLILPDSCFAGCTNLETVDFVLKSKRSGGQVALTPDNFILSGRDLFAGCDTTNLHILVGEDVLEEFLEDPYWSYYANRFKAVEVAPNPVKYTEGNINYGYAYYNNTTPLMTEENDKSIYHLNVVGGNEMDLNDNSGRAILVNDLGTFYSYKVDNIEKKAFAGNPNLRSFHFMDTNSNIGKAHTDLSVNICDSAFVGCWNFKDLYLVYWKTTGTNTSVSISPDSLRLGKDVFANCDSLTIKLCIDQEDAYLADTCWNKYKDKFCACLFKPRDEKVKELFESHSYVSPLSGQTTEHVDISPLKPKDIATMFADHGEITSFDEFRAFASCGLDTIYDKMFIRCSAMQSIKLPKTIKGIGDYAFEWCTRLSTMTIPDSVKHLGSYIWYLSGIKQLVFDGATPPTCTENCKETFYGLTDKSDFIIYVPDSAVTAYKTAWADVKDHIQGISRKHNLKEVHLTTPGTLADSLGLTYNYVSEYDEDITLKGSYAQYDSLRISGPLDGRDIGVLRYLCGRDVEDCEETVGNVRYLDLYDADLKAGEYEYNRDGSNDYIQEDDCVDTYMFSYLDALETLILPRSAKKIKKYAAAYCTKLKTLVVGDNVTEIAKNIVHDDMSLDYLVMFNKKVPDTSSSAWDKNSTQIQAVVVPNGSKADYMSTYGYYHYADTLTYGVMDDALMDALKKQHIYSPSDIVNINDISGWLCGNDKVKNFNELYYTNVIALGDSSFVDMKSLEEISLPANLLYITADAFKGCESLKTIWAMGNYIPTLADGAFDKINQDFVIWVVEGTEDAYRKAWPAYADHIRVIGSEERVEDDILEVTLTRANTLADKLGLKVDMYEGTTLLGKPARIVKSITGDYSNIKALKVNGPIGGCDIAVLRLLGGRDANDFARVYMSNMSYLDLYDANIIKEDTTTTFGYNPKIFGYFDLEFSSARYIEEANKIPRMMFRALDNIQTLILPRTATELGYESCYDMYSLKKLVIGDDMETIANDALGECNNLRSIIMLSTKKPELNHDAFTDPTFEGDVLKIDNFFVPKSLNGTYTSDTQYVQHASNITSLYNDDEAFRALGRHAIASSDDLSGVKRFARIFRDHCENVHDLSMLNKTSVDSVFVGDFQYMTNLQRISLPSTVKSIAPKAFYNSLYHWIDLSECSSLATSLDDLVFPANTLVYAPESMGETDKENIVWQEANGDLQCAKFNYTLDHDYDVPKAFTAKQVLCDQHFYNPAMFDNDAYFAFTLPFDWDVPTGTKVYSLKDMTSDHLVFERTKTAKANYPYMLTAPNQTVTVDIKKDTYVPVTPVRLGQFKSTNYTMTGTLSFITNADAVGMNTIVMDNDGVWNKLTTDEGTTGVDAFSAYVQARNSTAATTSIASEFLDFPTVTIDEATDNDSVIAANNGMTVTASLKRTLTAGTWNTFCGPFTTKIEGTPLEGASVLGLSGVEGNVYSFAKADQLKAGEPYLVKPTADIANPTFEGVKIENTLRDYNEAYDFLGIYSPMLIDATKTIYFLGSDGKLKLAKAGTTMKGMRAYFKVPSGNEAKPILVLGDDEEITAIDEVEADPATDNSTAVYSVNGIYMGDDINSLPSGVYIVNGKKVIK
jgi:hypothetical protein